MILGTINSIDDENGIQIIIDGEDEATTKKYSYLSSYVPAVDDRVLIEEISGSYVIIGRIITETAESGISNYATNAANSENSKNAENAVNAQNAQNAQNAENAKTAESATKADRATNADNATSAENAMNATNATNAVNAQTATTAQTAQTATTATNATNATNADTAKALDSMNYSTSNGKLVTNVERVYNSQLGTYIVTNVSTEGISNNYVYKR